MKKEPETIRIMLDYLNGPIWFSDVETGKPMTGIEIVDNDRTVKELNYIISGKYNDYYEFNSHGMPCWFDLEKEKADKEIMLDLITKLIFRLNEINDGSYVIEDQETERLKKL